MYALLIASDPDDVAIFSLILQRAGLAVTTSKDLDQAMNNWIARPADIVVLALPNSHLHEQVRRVRAEAQVPMIVVAEDTDSRAHRELLKLGADLIVGSSFNPKILITQVEALMRRAGNVPSFSLPTLRANGLTLDPSTRTVQVEDKPTKRLTHLEFRLIYVLITNRGQVLPADTIVERVWGFTGQGDRDLLRGLISRLRNKVELEPRKPRYIITVPGIGYTFEEPGRQNG